ncbi:MAG TPA: hypothetical protein VNO70_18230 [Blastocatellia bacterium]|nr:hypothetical protein [Blastocatellia bacterium]
MKRLEILSLLVGFVALFVVSGCGGEPDPNRGFDVETVVVANGTEFRQSARVVGDFLRPTASSTVGTVTHFDQFLIRATISGAKVPGVWRFVASQYAGCFETVVRETTVTSGDNVTLPCRATGVGSFTASPNTVDVTAPPATGTVYGQGISATYGMPIVAYYSEFGYLVAKQTASSVAADGTWLQGSVPNLDGAYSGVYTLLIKNKNADGSKTIIGTATINVTGNDPPPPPDGGGECQPGMICQ